MSPRIQTASRAKSGIAVVLVGLLALIAAPPAHGSSVRVPADFYGVNFQRIKDLSPEVRALQLERLESLGISQIRFNVSWASIEPLAPTAGVHGYRWDRIDDQITAMARHGMRAQPTLTQPPYWAAQHGLLASLQCLNARSLAPMSAGPYVAFVHAFADRYGHGGSFWRDHPSLPAEPVFRYEIWNEPNLKASWCPTPQPELYAKLFVGATAAIPAVDPNAQVVTGAVAATREGGDAQHVPVADFLARATASEPLLASAASAVAVHVYPPTDPLSQLARLAWFRTQLRDGGIADAKPMLVNEIGWATMGGPAPVGEPDRTDAYSRMTVDFARTNCNVSGIMAHTWVSPEQNPQDPEDWYGIADPNSAQPYPSALAYTHGVQLMRGDLSTEPPMATLMACPGMPLPDSDADGTPDEDDYYPLDASRS